MTNYINYIHLFDIQWVNIIVSLIVFSLIMFFFTYMVERIYGEISYKKRLAKKKEKENIK